MPAASENSVEEDRELVRRIAAGEVEVFAKLYARHSPALLLFIKSRLGATDSADEVHNEVWTKLFRKPPLDAEQHIRGWLFLVARREIANHWRTQGRNPHQLPDDAEFLLSAPIPLAADDERRKLDLEGCLGELAPEFSEVVRRSMLGETHGHIARHLGIAENTSYTRFSRSKLKLRECMERKGWTG